MDPSALIFIALAVAWAVYLIPKALEHHEESVRSRTVERFSATMRVLARREPVSRRKARLVRAGSSSSDAKVLSNGEFRSTFASLDDNPAPNLVRQRIRRAAAARAAKRRLRVVTVILLAIAVVAGLAGRDLVAWRWSLVPVGVLVAWLVACRLMVERERREVGRGRRPRPDATAPAATALTDDTGPIYAVPADPAPATADDQRPSAADPESWDPVPVTLPTYVSKPVAPRSVRTIDLDSTGVWSSGRSESDSDLVRKAAREAEDRDESSKSRRRHA